MYSIWKKSTLIALSSTEAEYIGMFEASNIIMWLYQLLRTWFSSYTPEYNILYEDNKSAIHIFKNGNDKGAQSTWT